MSNYQDVLLLQLCLNPREECFFGECEQCPKENFLEKLLNSIFEKKKISQIKQWISQPRSTLEAVQISSKEFVKFFCKSSTAFLFHSFIMTQQTT